jgi:hypothetical protein
MQYDLDSKGYLYAKKSMQALMLQWGQDIGYVSFLVVLDRINPKTKSPFRCAYSAVPTEWKSLLIRDQDFLRKYQVTQVCERSPVTHLGVQWETQMAGFDLGQIVGFDWLNKHDQLPSVDAIRTHARNFFLESFQRYGINQDA